MIYTTPGNYKSNTGTKESLVNSSVIDLLQVTNDLPEIVLNEMFLAG